MEFNEKDFTNILDAMSKSIEEESNGTVIDETFYSERADWKDPENIDYIVSFHVRQRMMNFIKLNHPEILTEEYNVKDYENIIGLFMYYNIIKKTLDQLAIGRSCSSDKSRTIIRSFRKNILNKDIEIEFPNITDEEHTFYHPDYGSSEEWFNLVSGLIEFNMTGNPTDFLKSYKVILDKRYKELERRKKLKEND